MTETLAYLIEEARKLPPMTEAERRTQRVSFAYGNLRLSGVEVTREDVERAALQLDSADLVSDEGGLLLPPAPPTIPDAIGPDDRGRRG